MSKFPQLTSIRLRLGQIEPKFIPKIVQYANNKTISDNTLTFPYPYTEENAKSWINFSNESFEKKENFVFGIYLKESGEFIGGMGLHLDKKLNEAELGYWIGEPFWNNGYATEAAKRILSFGFDELKLNKIHASHFLYNPTSGKILTKIGMNFIGEIKDDVLKNGKYEMIKKYQILKEDFEKLTF